jgi:hypothetical protein
VDDFYVRYRSEALEIDPLPRGPFADRERMRTELTVVFHYGEPMAKVVLSGLHGDPEVAALEAAHVDAMIELTANLMAAAQKRGEIPPDRDPTFIGAMLIGGMRRVLAIALASDPPIPRRATASKLWALNAAVMGVTTPFDDG